MFGSRQRAKGRRLKQEVSTWDQSPGLENSSGGRTLFRGVPEEEPVTNIKEKYRYHHGFGSCDQLFSGVTPHNVSFPMFCLVWGGDSLWRHWWWTMVKLNTFLKFECSKASAVIKLLLSLTPISFFPGLIPFPDCFKHSFFPVFLLSLGTFILCLILIPCLMISEF